MATTEQTNYAVATLDDVAHGDEHHGRVRHSLRKHFDIQSFGVHATRAVRGDGQVIGEHTEDGIGSRAQEELYVVLSGKATFTLDGEEVKASPGTMVFARPGVKRSAIAHEEGTTVLVVGNTPGEAFRLSPYELVEPMWESYRAEDFEGAAAILEGILAEYPGEPLALFNLACCESRLGRTGQALEHLERAVAADVRFRAMAREDDDFTALRGQKRFEQLIV